MGTFRIDDVESVRDRLPARRFADQLGETLAVGGDPDRPVVDHGPTHPLLGAVHLAFAQHRPLVLSPDVVWLTIAQGVAHHVRLNAEALRSRLVRHAGKKTLTVDWDGPMPTDAATWASIVERFRDLVGAEVGDGRARLLECDFSTTTEVERVASRIVLMDVYAPYFDYRMMCVCGIPELTLLGTVEDWRAIRSRIDVIAELDLSWWTRSLAPIADQFVRAADGDVDVAFWKRILKPREVYGGDVITGWIARLYPYLESGGRVELPNPMLEVPFDELSGDGISSDMVPGGPSTARVRVMGIERRVVALDGGVLAVTQDDDGRLMPICGWALRDATPSISDVIDRIRTDHQTTPTPETEERQRASIEGPAEVIALNHAFDGAVLFEGSQSWTIRRLDRQDRVEVPLPDGRTCSITRLIDLPDGTYLALSDTQPAVIVRGRADAITTAPLIPSWPDGPERGETTEPAAELPIVATSLAALLEAALDSGGALDLPTQGVLLKRIRGWDR